MVRVEVGKKKYRVYQERFGSLRALLVANEREKQDRNESGYECFYESFNGVRSYDEAKQLAKTGYTQPIEKMKERIKQVRSASRKKNVVRNDVVGYAPNVPNAVMGLPYSMINSHIKRFPMKVVRIKYLNAFNCWVEKEDAEKAGVRLVEAVLRLEAEGYRVALECITIVQSNKDADKIGYLSTRIKEAQQPMDLKKMAYPLVHVSYHRALAFRWFSTSPKCPDLGRGLGGSYTDRRSYESAVEMVRKLDRDKHAVVLDIQTVIKQEDDNITEMIKKMMVS